MENFNLLSICGSAFLAVYLILIVLALLMRLIILAFPADRARDESSIFAAIFSTYAHIFPATKVTKIEELK